MRSRRSQGPTYLIRSAAVKTRHRSGRRRRSKGGRSRRRSVANVKGRVEDAVKKGAKVLAGGEAGGACYRATLISDVPVDSDLARYETFGPVATIEVVDSAEEAVARANATSYGLSSGLISQNADRALALAQGIDAGIVHINDQPIGDEPQMPFGGVKDSGYGASGAGPSLTSSRSCAG